MYKKGKLLLVAAVSALALAACSGTAGASDSNEKVSINLWAGFTGADAEVMGTMVDGFMKENPNIAVEYYTAPWNEMFTKFATAYGTDSGPDAVIMHATDIPNFAKRNMLAPLDDLTGDLGVEASDYAAPVWAGNAYGGTQLGIPLDFHPMAVFKNVAAFEAAGIDPNIEFTSKEQFLEVAHKLTSSGQYGIGIGSDHAHTMRYWYGLLYQAGGSLLNDDGTRAEFNSPEGVEALQFLSDLVNVEKVAPAQQSDIDRDFLAGTTAMVIEGPWFIPTMEESGMEYTTAPFPQIFDQPATWAGTHTLTVPAQAISDERRAAAIQLVSYIAKNSFEWGAGSGQIPASAKVRDSAEYKALPIYDKAQAFIAEADYVHYEPLIPKTAELGADNQLSPILSAVLDAVRGSSSPKDALNGAVKSTDDILSQ